ncbi:carbohydrate ABC transporter permease [Tetragenococcus halophilus]|uniref:carbohydrate ABC transporter permease n=1 Tax=Tetragenococcus halophilus TaxID=51669 RepID=UPI00209ADF87|nr:carbohydrate ABC transporter permease [Tetragenococcus halophilus]MCO8289237.1 carbohydrate ABC transporter permease [Tetragenococcus halophilus]
MKKQFDFNKLLVIILAIVLALSWLYPFFLIFINSFKTRTEILSNVIGLPEKITLANYPNAFQAMNYVSGFGNSVIITVASVGLTVLFSAMAAYVLHRRNSKLSTFIYYFCGVTMLIPFQAIMIPLINLFGQINLLNRTGLTIMNIGFSVSLSVYLYYGAMRSISTDLDDAANIDGASRISIFFRVILPILKPTTVTVIILNGMKIRNDYLLPSLVVNQQGMRTLPLELYSFFGEFTTQWELALTGLLLAIIPVILLFISLQKYFIAGISEGSLKM